MIMFEPRLSHHSIIRMARSEYDGPRRLGELTNPKDVADPSEWGCAAEAPTDSEPAKRLGMFPYTP